MAKMQHYIGRILDEVTQSLSKVDEVQFDSLCEAILAARRIFVTGQGRSGLVARTFAMRLMHLGLDARVTGETTTPPIGIDDLLVAVSRSGERPVTCAYLRTAKQQRAGAVVVTGHPDSSAAKLGSFTVVLAPDDVPTAQVAGSLFEQSCMLYFDAVIQALADRLGISHDEMLDRHANLE